MQLHYTQEFLHLLQLILRVGKQFKNHLELVMKTVVQGVFFSSSRDGPSLVSIIKQSNYTTFATSDLLYVRDTHYSISDELIKNFCIDVVRQVPAVSRCLLPVVRVISEEKSDASSFLFEFLSLALSGDSSMVSNEGKIGIYARKLFSICKEQYRQSMNTVVSIEICYDQRAAILISPKKIKELLDIFNFYARKLLVLSLSQDLSDFTY